MTVPATQKPISWTWFRETSKQSSIADPGSGAF